MTKDQKTIKAQAVQITGLTNEIERLKSDLETVRTYREQYSKELADAHATFDLLGIPRRPKDTYCDLSVNARFTLFLAQRSGIQIKKDTDKEDCDW